jgi:hypothetical protein
LRDSIFLNISAEIDHHNIWWQASSFCRRYFLKLRFFRYLLRIFAIPVEQIGGRAYNERSMVT